MKKLIFAALALLALTACRDKYVARITDLRLVSVDPRTGSPGELVTIFGWNFSPEPSENEVCFGGERAIVLEASSGRLQVVLPNLPVGNYKISVKSPSGYQEGLSFSFLTVISLTKLLFIISLSSFTYSVSWCSFSILTAEHPYHV